MKKNIQPYPRLNIFIHTNGATYNDSLYSVNMWKTLPIQSNKQILHSLNETTTFNLKKKHKIKLENLINKYALSAVRYTSDVLTPEGIKPLGQQNETQSCANVTNINIKENTAVQADLAARAAYISTPLLTVSCKNLCQLIFLKIENLCAGVSVKTETRAPKTNLISFLNLSSINAMKIKSLDIDTCSNPLWNGNKNSRFGTFEQVSDNALSKFKKRYGANSVKLR